MSKETILLDPTDRVTITGLPGTGKTVLARYIASFYVPNLLIYDPLAQYEGFPEECRYIPRSDSLAEFDAICRQLRARSGVVFMVEECERYLGQGKPLGEHTFDLINRGRNWNIGIVAVTRRIQRLSKDFFDLCQVCFFFRCGLKSRSYLEDMIGKEAVAMIRRLPEYHFLYYNIETEEYLVRTLDLGGRPSIKEGKKEKEIIGGKREALSGKEMARGKVKQGEEPVEDSEIEGGIDESRGRSSGKVVGQERGDQGKIPQRLPGE